MSKKEGAAICKRAAYLRKLLKEFEATLCGFDPGVTAFLPNHIRGEGYMGESLSFDGIEWGWLEPLLLELKAARKAKART